MRGWIIVVGLSVVGKCVGNGVGDNVVEFEIDMLELLIIEVELICFCSVGTLCYNWNMLQFMKV